MHSRIFGIIPLEQYNNYSADDGPTIDILEEEVPSFADYTSRDTNLVEDLDWLVDVLKSRIDETLFTFDRHNKTIKFHVGFKEAYFKDSFSTLIKTLLSPDAFDSFCGITPRHGNCDAYSLKKLIEEEYGFYVSDTYGSWETLDSFIRRVDYDTEYKVFQSLDYHY